MNHPKMKYVYVGIDSHKETHTAVIMDCFSEKMDEVKFPNVPSEFENFLNQIREIVKKGIIEERCAIGTVPAFGLEDTSTYGRSLAVFLRDNGQIVKHIHAYLVYGYRKAESIDKTDSADAECAARVLYGSFNKRQNANPQDKYWVLGKLVARRNQVVKMNRALRNQLHAFITSNYPGYRGFFENIDCNSSLAFYEKYPSPSKLRGITAEELAEMLEEYSNKRLRLQKAREILDCVERAGNTTIEFQETSDLVIPSIIRQYRRNVDEMNSLEAIIADFLNNFPYQLTSMAGIDTITAAGFISEIGDIRRFPSPAKLAYYCGVAPITVESGEEKKQFPNKRGNRSLNSLFYMLAVRLTMPIGKEKRIVNPFFYEYYNQKLSDGKAPRQAMKCVERRLVNIIWRMMTYNEKYVNPPSYNLPKTEK
ncbi:MAG: IS110 family transposase [Solirubrobacterales bacterium]